MKRRTLLKGSAGTAAVFTLTDCLGDGEGESESTETTSATEAETTNSTESGEASELPETIAIGSDIPHRPFEYETIKGDLTGFDVDIAEAVFDDQLGVDYEFKPASFDSITPSLNNNNFRIIISVMTISDQHVQGIDFSNPYFTAYQTVIARQDSDIQPGEDLRGATVGVQKDTAGADAALELQEEFDGELELSQYDQAVGVFQALINGWVVAVVNDNTVSAGFVNNQDEGKIRFPQGEGVTAGPDESTPDYLTLTVENYGIAFRQDDDEFRRRVDEVLAVIKENRTYDEICTEYFES